MPSESRRSPGTSWAFALVVSASIVLFACGTGPVAPGPDTAPLPPASAPVSPVPEPAVEVRTFERDGELWLERAGEAPRLLADDGRGYVTHISPDGRWVAFDVVLFSNLQVTRLMRRDEATGRYESAGNLSTAAWTRAAAALGVGIDEIDNARSSFAGWSDTGDAALIELSGLGPDGGEIERTERVPLPR